MCLENGEFAYVLRETIGVGATGKVKLGVHKLSGEKVAVKMVSAKLFQEKPDLLKKVLRECEIMTSVAHPHVVNFLGQYQAEDCLYLVLELVTGGELFDYLLKTGRQTEEQARKLFRQLIDAVYYCHKMNVCHRDIKPENLLLDQGGNIKVADFGYAQYMRNASDGSSGWVETSCGSPHYASPEVIIGDRYVGFQADIWSCGVVLFALLTGGLPFDDENLQKLLHKVKRGAFQIPSWVPEDAADLVRRMLTVDPAGRITSSKIQEHSWFIGPVAVAAAPPAVASRMAGRFTVTPVVEAPQAAVGRVQPSGAEDLAPPPPTHDTALGGPPHQESGGESGEDRGGAGGTGVVAIPMTQTQQPTVTKSENVVGSPMMVGTPDVLLNHHVPNGVVGGGGDSSGGGSSEGAALIDIMMQHDQQQQQQKQGDGGAGGEPTSMISSIDEDLSHYINSSASRQELSIAREELARLQRHAAGQHEAGHVGTTYELSSGAAELEQLQNGNTQQELARVRAEIQALSALPNGGGGGGGEGGAQEPTLADQMAQMQMQQEQQQQQGQQQGGDPDPTLWERLGFA